MLYLSVAFGETNWVSNLRSCFAGERVVVVTHGGVLRELYERAAPTGSINGKIQNTSVNVFHISDSGGQWIIKTWGDISHLQETGVLDSAFGGDGTSA